ncbi:fungal-specific transcription factor domain-containing protein [Daldinia sp. FL1419]|nr:fungal-specific transcription factor domain-containing protein [Daldinia sp. FL1419]
MNAKKMEKELELAIVECSMIKESTNLKVLNLDRGAAARVKQFPSKRKTNGSGLHLSWPNASDGRRAVVGKSPPHAPPYTSSSGNPSAARITHVSYGDVEMHYHFRNSRTNNYTCPISIPLSWNPLRLKFSDPSLFEYFQSTASQSLPILGHDPVGLGNTIIRIALGADTTSATAALQSLLAFSSLHRHDVHSQAVEFKISAIKSLSAAAKGQLSLTEAIQHVVAGMLLCSFEVYQASCTSGQWMWYLSGVKNIIKTVALDKYPQSSDLAMLLDWVYYYDILARFTLRHWNKENTESISSVRAEPSHTPPPALATMALLSEVCDAVSSKPPNRMSVENVDDYKSFLKILDWRIRNMPMQTAANDDADTPLIMELYQLAMLVYLNQASGDLLNQTSTRTQHYIDKAFVIFSQLESCVRQFPIFILGCEARRDEQRTVILDLISRSEKQDSSRSFNHTRILTQAIWAQDDLSNGDINYWDKLSHIITRCSIPPLFV